MDYIKTNLGEKIDCSYFGIATQSPVLYMDLMYDFMKAYEVFNNPEQTSHIALYADPELVEDDEPMLIREAKGFTVLTGINILDSNEGTIRIGLRRKYEGE